jgi:hypothetical protein
VLVVEVGQVEGGWRGVLEVGEPFVDKSAQIVGVQRRETTDRLEAPDLRLVLVGGDRLGSDGLGCSA